MHILSCSYLSCREVLDVEEKNYLERKYIVLNYMYLSYLPCFPSDSTTRRLNKVLIDSGFAPEWISLDKEIRQDVYHLRESLLIARKKLGPSPLAMQADNQWNHILREFENKLCFVNKKIDKFNMIVPILNKQKVHVNFDREVNRALEDYGYGMVDDIEIQMHSTADQNKSGHKNVVISYFLKLFERY